MEDFAEVVLFVIGAALTAWSVYLTIVVAQYVHAWPF